MDFIRKDRSLLFKLILLFFIGFSAVFLIVFVYSYNVSKNLSEIRLRHNLEHLALLHASALDNTLLKVMKNTDNLALDIQTAGYAPAETAALIAQFLGNNAEIQGAAIAPDALSADDAEGYTEKYFYSSNGRTEVRTIGDKPADHQLKDGYVVAGQTEKSAWIASGQGQQGKSAQLPVYAVPLYRYKNGRRDFFGLLSVDLSTDYLKDLPDGMGFSEDGNTFFILNDSAVILHSGNELPGRENTEVGEELKKQIAQSGKGVLALRGGEENFLRQQNTYLAFAPLTTLKGTTVIVMSEKGSAAEHRVMVSNFLISTLAGFLSLSLLFFFVLLIVARKGAPEGTVVRTRKKAQDALPDIAELTVALKEKQDALEAAQLQLIESERMASIGQLTAGIAHEIKNPLNFVNNFALLTVSLANELNEELEKLSEKLPENDKEYLLEITGDIQSNATKINEHGKRAESIVKGMLLQSRGTSGEFQPTDVNALLAEYVNLGYHGMRAQDANFNIRIDADYDKTIGQVKVIPQNLSRVFLNIVNNACYATNEKKILLREAYNPVLSIKTKNFDEHFEIHIRDNGKGIPKAVLDKVFNPFFTTKPPGQGTGLGLSLSQDIIVKEHHGSMKVESVEGEFAEFIISIPKNLH
jgi:signal transduction histidine kinase